MVPCLVFLSLLSLCFGQGTSGVSQEDITEIVDTHNKFRASTTPTAANMQKLYWDKEIAKKAQDWADNCTYKHDDGDARAIKRMSLGQNIARNWYGKKDWKKMMGLWHGEVKDFVYGGNRTKKVVGHYTQVVWANTSLIGCGYKKCPPDEKLQYDWHMYVCNYGPPGNNYDTKYTPYKKGPKGSDCKNNLTPEGLCDCKGKTCINGGTLNVSSCTCQCGDVPWLVQPDCRVDCSKATDTNCAGWMKCNWRHIPLQKCPKKCKICA